MVKFINSWAQGIILAVIIATIIEIILPEGNNKKYVKTIIGIYILFAIIYPILSNLSSKNININSIINSTNKEIAKYEANSNLALETNSYIENTYKTKIEEDINKILTDKGYNVISLNTNIETESEERYGQINSLTIKIEKINEEENNKINQDNSKRNNNTTNVINKIDKVEISINSYNNSNDTDIKQKETSKVSDIEIQDLKEYLNITYGIKKDSIYIN